MVDHIEKLAHRLRAALVRAERDVLHEISRQRRHRPVEPKERRVDFDAFVTVWKLAPRESAHVARRKCELRGCAYPDLFFGRGSGASERGSAGVQALEQIHEPEEIELTRA
jgi:hypothetical protein